MIEDHEVLVSAEYLAELERDSVILGKLYRAGVDNWDFYDDAMGDEHE